MSVEFRDLLLELSLPSIARVSHANHGYRICDAMSRSGGIVADGYDARWTQQNNELLEQFFASLPLASIVLPIGERISRFMRMKRKDVPEEDPSINVLQHAPYDRGGSFGYSTAYRWPFDNLVEIPTSSMLAYVNIIGQG